MEIATHSPQTMRAVFDRYAGGEDDDYGLRKTHVPLVLARYGEENLLSRSQARRIVSRVERFQEVVLDFAGVEMIGQGFADAVFRVFQSEHPNIVLTPIRANDDVRKMIRHVLAGAKGG